MNGRFLIATGVMLALVTGGASLALADGKYGREEVDPGGLIDPHVRYPGDVSYPFGTVRVRGPEKGPYVERCQWVYKIGVMGIPYGLTQVCRRYTLDNTK